MIIFSSPVLKPMTTITCLGIKKACEPFHNPLLLPSPLHGQGPSCMWPGPVGWPISSSSCPPTLRSSVFATCIFIKCASWSFSGYFSITTVLTEVPWDSGPSLFPSNDLFCRSDLQKIHQQCELTNQQSCQNLFQRAFPPQFDSIPLDKLQFIITYIRGYIESVWAKITHLLTPYFVIHNQPYSDIPQYAQNRQQIFFNFEAALLA